MGVIASKEIKEKRIEIHNIIDPLFLSGKINRKELYKVISDRLGYTYHTANIKTTEEANKILQIVYSIQSQE